MRRLTSSAGTVRFSICARSVTRYTSLDTSECDVNVGQAAVDELDDVASSVEIFVDRLAADVVNDRVASQQLRERQRTEIAHASSPAFLEPRLDARLGFGLHRNIVTNIRALAKGGEGGP